MKRLLIAATAATCVCGCVYTHIEGNGWKMRRLQIAQGQSIPSIRVDTNGCLTVLGYVNDGGSSNAEQMACSLLATAIKAAK